MKVFIKITFLLTLFALKGFSQEDIDFENRKPNDNSNNQKKIVKPKIDTWKLNYYGAFNDSIPVDTMMDYYHLYNPIYKNVFTVSELGNYATPYIYNDFFSRESKMDFFFIRSREAYLLTPSDILFYNTRTPYTILDYTQSENKSKQNETRFNVLHTQNLNPFLNITFRFDMARSQGQYQNQESKNKSLSLYSSYTKDKYNLYAGFISSTIGNKENGGLPDDDLIFSDDDQDFINVNLANTNTNLSNNTFFANGEYRIGRFYEKEDDTIQYFKPILGILYSTDYQRNYKVFNENEAEGNLFFPVSNFVNDFTSDSLSFNKFRNIIQIKQYENDDKKFTFGKRIFLGQEFVSLSMPNAVSVLTERKKSKFSNVYAGGGIFRETGNFWKWNFEGKLYLLGRNAGQTELSGIISKPLILLKDSLAILKINGKIENLVADYFQEEFLSNHIKWKNNFKMEQRMIAGGVLDLPKYNVKAGANYAIINNFIYNDTTGIPRQTGKELLVISAFVDKDFIYKRLHFRTRLLWQKASDKSYIQIPDFSTYISSFYQFWLYKVMFVQLGFDGKYNTKFYANAYDPSTGLFYSQFDKKIGGFPYLDAYASIKLKRTKIFFRLMNVGAGLKNVKIPGEYFTAYHYPMNRQTYRIGVNWAFYD